VQLGIGARAELTILNDDSQVPALQHPGSGLAAGLALVGLGLYLRRRRRGWK
jgi:MYXO-CTERM domain-containing protein